MSFFKKFFGKKVLHEGEDIIQGIFLQLFNHFKWFIYFLFIASSNGHIEVVKELLDRGANIEEKDNDGYTPLIYGIFLK